MSQDDINEMDDLEILRQWNQLKEGGGNTFSQQLIRILKIMVLKNVKWSPQKKN